MYSENVCKVIKISDTILAILELVYAYDWFG